MKSFVFPLIVFAFMVMVSCGTSGRRDEETFTLDVSPAPPQTGQWFEYEHTGPRPWGDSGVDASGSRLIRILGSQNEEDVIYWLVEETYTADSDEQISIYDSRYHLHRQLSRSDVLQAVYQYDPPLSDRHIDLRVDGEKTEESLITIQNSETGQNYGTIQLTRATKRGRDERVVTKAGAYLCRHFVSRTKIKYQFQSQITEINAKEDTYWCDQITWFVLERVEVEPALQDGNFAGTGHVSQSTLTDFEQEP